MNEKVDGTMAVLTKLIDLNNTSEVVKCVESHLKVFAKVSKSNETIEIAKHCVLFVGPTNRSVLQIFG